ncbi:MAG: hypothetical protein WBQ23_00085, partial [Bacteroidota bacterium]
MKGKPLPTNFKIVMVVMAIAIVISVLFYTQSIVEKLQVREHQSADRYTKAIEWIANDASQSGDFTFAFGMVEDIDFPILMTDKDLVVISSKNMNLDSAALTPEEIIAEHERLRDEFAKVNPP